MNGGRGSDASEDLERICRICRSHEGENDGDSGYGRPDSQDDALRRPCECKGGLAYVHPSCLSHWLEISKKNACEVCGKQFKWDKVFSQETPDRLPPHLVLRHVILGLFHLLQYAARALLVLFLWIGFLPYTILWAWRAYFSLGSSWGAAWSVLVRDSRWSLQTFFAGPSPYAAADRKAALERLLANLTGANIAERANGTILSGNNRSVLANVAQILNGARDEASQVLRDAAKTEGTASAPNAINKTTSTLSSAVVSLVNGTISGTQTDSSLNASLPEKVVNIRRRQTLTRAVLERLWSRNKDYIATISSDIFTGQIIVCVVVVLFVAAFLLREWVLSNQVAGGVAGQAEVAVRAPAVNAAEQARPQLFDDPERMQLLADVLQRAEERVREDDVRRDERDPDEIHPFAFLEDAPQDQGQEVADTEESKAEENSREAGDSVEAMVEITEEKNDNLTPGQAASRAALRRSGQTDEPRSVRAAVPTLLDTEIDQEEQSTSSNASKQGVEAEDGRTDLVKSHKRVAFEISEDRIPRYTREEKGKGREGASEDGESNCSDEEDAALHDRSSTFSIEVQAPESENGEAVSGYVDNAQPPPTEPTIEENRPEVKGDAIPAAPVPVTEPNEQAAQPPPAPIDLDVQLEEESDSDTSSSSEDDDDDDDDPDPLLPPLRGNIAAGQRGAGAGDIPAEDLAAIQAAENEEELFFEADIDGILEAVGMKGPIMALLQNVALITLLITLLLGLAVWAPLMIGKTVVAMNLLKLLLLPVQLVRYLTDPVADGIVLLVKMAQQMLFLGSDCSGSSGHESSAKSLKARVVEVWQIAQIHAKTFRKESSLQGEGRGAWHTTAFAAVRGKVLEYEDRAYGTLHHASEITKARWAQMGVSDTDADRILCILLGYAVFLVAGSLYLRHTQNASARQATRAIRDVLSHQFTLGKAALFFIIEIILFPTLCGLLINLATIPFFSETDIATRLAYHVRAPLSSGFVTWLAGTNFMYLFATWISIVRKTFRKGVLWFIRDPADPDSNPLREILETPAFNQAKKIARSLLVYGGIVLSCFGTLPWVASYLNIGILPLRWNLLRQLSSIPIDLLFVHFIVPHTLGRSRPRRAVRKAMSEWAILTAHQLRLSSFMLDARRPEEEGSHIRKTWSAWFLFKKAHVPSSSSPTKAANEASSADVVFRNDGGFARVVAADNVKIVSKAMFVFTDEHGAPTSDEGREAVKKQLEGGKNDESKFTTVYIPPHFKTRVVLFMYLLWLTGSVAIFMAFSLPLLAGRLVLDWFFAEPLHDAYSMLVGLHVFYGIRQIQKISSRHWRTYRKRSFVKPVDGQRAAWAAPSILKSGAQAAKQAALACAFLFQLSVILPLLTGLAVHLFVTMHFETSKDDIPTLSLGMDWAYGCIYLSLAISVARACGANAMAEYLTFTESRRSIFQPYFRQVSRLTLFNLRLLVAVALPSKLTNGNLILRKLVWQLIASNREPMPPFNEVASFHGAVLVVLTLGLGRLFWQPIQKVTRTWAKKIWEKEYVVQRKLRNIDDPPLGSLESENVSGASQGSPGGADNGSFNDTPMRNNIHPEIPVD